MTCPRCGYDKIETGFYCIRCGWVPSRIMKHNWEIKYLPLKQYRNSEFPQFQYKHRVCKNCEQEQVQEANYEWMRVKNYYWYPKVTRCRGVICQTKD